MSQRDSGNDAMAVTELKKYNSDVKDLAVLQGSEYKFHSDVPPEARRRGRLQPALWKAGAAFRLRSPAGSTGARTSHGAAPAGGGVLERAPHQPADSV